MDRVVTFFGFCIGFSVSFGIDEFPLALLLE